MMPGMVLHFLYGVGGGAVLVAVLLAAGAETVGLIEAAGIGLGYGVVLFVAAAAFWMNVVLDMDADPQTAGTFLFFHLVYGGLLGAVLGAGLL
jgi:hypothetical protein